LRQQPPAVHRPGRRHDRPGAGLAAPLRRGLLSRLHRVRSLVDADGRRPHFAVRRRPAWLPRPGDPHPGHRGLHRRCRAPHHRHADRSRVGRAAAVRAFGHPSAGLPGRGRRGWSRRDVLVPGLFAACVAIALLARRLFPRIPDALVVVALAFATTFAWTLSERGVEMVGALPTGLPPISVPSLTPLLSGQLWASAALLALVGMTETSSISRFVARRTGQRSDPGREALGQGLANVAVAFVGGYPVCASLSGTSVNLAGGARGPRPIYFFTVLALLVALSLGPLFAYLPRFALAAVVIMAVASLLDPRRLLALCRADRLDALVVLTTFAVTLLVGPERGILAGVAAAWLCYLWRTRRVPVHERLWRPAGASEHDGPACFVLRPCSSLLYPNAEAIHDEAL